MRHIRKQQPRIRGLNRIGKHSGLLPEIERGIEKIAVEEGWTFSRVVAHIVSDWFDIDSDSGRLLSEKRDGRWREPIAAEVEVARARAVLKQQADAALKKQRPPARTLALRTRARR